MKFALTITEATPSELSALLLALNGSTAPFNATMQAAATAHAAGNNDDSDDNGPADPNAPAIDKEGLPWDERIHSSNKQMTDKGVWRKRRGVSNDTVAAVENELRAKAGPGMPIHQEQPSVTTAVSMPAPAPQPIPMPMPAPNGYPTGPGYPQQPANVVAPAAPQMPPQPMPMPAPSQPTAPAMPATPVAAPMMDFPTFMQALSGQMQKRDAAGMPLIDTDYLARVTSEIGTAFATPLGVITDIVSQPRAGEMIVYAVQCLTRDGKWN